MAFKFVDGSPVLMCDICGNRIYDPFGDLASTTLGGDGNIVMHHQLCATTEAVHLPLNKFFALFSMSGYGDRSSNGTVERVTLEIGTGETFE